MGEDELEVKAPFGWAKASGSGPILLFCVAVLLAYLYLHDVRSQESGDRTRGMIADTKKTVEEESKKQITVEEEIREELRVQSYLLTLNDAELHALHITMPVTLRQRLQPSAKTD